MSTSGMKKIRGQGVERIMKKLEANIEQGQYYEAHQMYRTLYFRYVSQKKYEELMSLLYDGAFLFLNHNQHNSGTDLAILVVKILNESLEPVSNEHMDKLGSLFSMMLPDSPERMTFLTSALQWSGKNGTESPVFGHPRLHQSVALTLWKEKNYQQSRYHFIHSTDGDNCANMLVEYHINKGYPSEVDLFIAQTVLQYLCLKNKTTASVAFHIYTEKHPTTRNTGFPFLLPLLNFLEFLLQAIEREKLAYFHSLCEKYQPSINRDPTYAEYVERIGQLFFGLSPNVDRTRHQGGGLFGNILQSLLGTFEENFNEDSEPVAGSSKGITYQIKPDELD